MAIFSITTDIAGQVGVKPQIKFLYCNNTFAEVTAANFLADSQRNGYVFNDGDAVAAIYGTTPTTQFFTVSKTAATITLVPAGGAVVLPVVEGNFAVFGNTTGAIDDAGYAPSDAEAAVVAMVADEVVVGNFATFVDTAGTIDDSGAKILSGTTATFAGGSASNAFTVAGLTATCRGTAVIRASTNAVSIAKAVPSENTLTITFSADPGAGTTVDYIYTTTGLT